MLANILTAHTMKSATNSEDGEFDTLYVGTIIPLGGSTVTVAGNLVPSQNNAYEIGTNLLRWGNIETVAQSVSSNITVSTIFPVTGTKIYVHGHLIPDGDNTYDIGEPGIKWRNIYAAGQADIDTALLSTLSSNNASLTLAKDILPNANNTISIGSNALRLNTVHNVRNYIPNDDSGTSFSSTSPITLLSGGNTPIALTISSPQYDNTDAYSFKIPQKGYYIMSFSVTYDTGPTSNVVDMWIFNGNISQDQQYASFNTTSLTPSNITFSFWANSLTDNFTIFAYSNSVNVTNFAIEWGRLMCASAHV